MRITNAAGLPQPLVDAVQPYRPKEGRLSVTELIDHPYRATLRRKHWDEITEDASDRIWAVLGTSVHAILDQQSTGNVLTEERLETDVAGVTVSGKPDLLDADGTLSDYKVTSVWAFLLGDMKDWTRQLNCYAWLYGKHGFEVKRLQIVAILRDWSRRRAATEDNYPSSPAIVAPIPLWDKHKITSYVKSRVDAHSAYRAGLSTMYCDAEARWRKPDRWAVHRKGRKRAIRLFDSAEEAGAYISDNPDDDGLYVDHRPGEDGKCANFCPVNRWCEYYAGIKEKEGVTP